MSVAQTDLVSAQGKTHTRDAIMQGWSGGACGGLDPAWGWGRGTAGADPQLGLGWMKEGRFILCVHLTGLRIAQKAGNTLPLGVSVGVFPEGIRLDLIDGVKHMTLPSVGGPLPSSPGWAPK